MTDKNSFTIIRENERALQRIASGWRVRVRFTGPNDEPVYSVYNSEIPAVHHFVSRDEAVKFYDKVS